MFSRKIIHIGEVLFDETQEPNAWVINVISKIEKNVDSGEIGFTETVRQMIIPEINSGKISITKYFTFEIKDGNYSVDVWKLEKYSL